MVTETGTLFTSEVFDPKDYQSSATSQCHPSWVMDAYGHIAFSVDHIYLSVSVPLLLLFNNFILIYHK